MSDTKYSAILGRADAFFRSALSTQPQNLKCGRGCSLCCHGLFEIGAADMAFLAEGLESLPPVRRGKLVRKAMALMRDLDQPDLREAAAEEKEAFFDRSSATPCPILDASGACTMYESRPLVCRTFGLPVREADGLLDVCELNFVGASDDEKRAAEWHLEWEDAISKDEQFTIPEAIVLIARVRSWIESP